MLSRYFNAPLSVDSVSFSPGSATFAAPYTIAALIRPVTGFASLTCFVISGNDSGGSTVWGINTDTGKAYTGFDFNGGPTMTADNWYWLVAGKASGSVLPRWGLHNLTAGTAWAHTDGGGNVPDGGGPVTSIIVGNSTAGGGADFYGQIAAVAVWGSLLSDAAVEAACTVSATDLLAASPAWMTRFNQASTATSVADDTGGGGGQSAISGTAVDANEPPGWSYTLTAASPPPRPPVVPVAAVHRAATY